MGFAEQAESWRAKAHLTGVRLPVLVGVTALAAIVLIAAGGALVKAGTSDGFSLSRDDGAATSDGTDEDGAASGEARTVFVHVGGASTMLRSTNSNALEELLWARFDLIFA